MMRLVFYSWEIMEVAKANGVDWFIGKEMFTANLTNGRNDNKGANTPYAILSAEWNELGLAEQTKQEAEFNDMISTGKGGKFKELSKARNAGDIDKFNDIVIAFDKKWVEEHESADYAKYVITPEMIEEQKRKEQEAWEEFRKEQAEAEDGEGEAPAEGDETAEVPETPAE